MLPNVGTQLVLKNWSKKSKSHKNDLPNIKN